MATPVIMPRQGQSVESCIFTEWLVEPGKQVSKGDLLFTYETDKAAFEAEAPEDGVLLAVFVEPGDAVPVLQNIGVIGEEGEDTASFRPGPVDESSTKAEREEDHAAKKKGATADAVQTTSQPVPAESGAGHAKDSLGVGQAGRQVTDKQIAPHSGTGIPGKVAVPAQAGDIRISPRARKTAGKHHVNYTNLQGTGPGGRILERDILNKLKSIPRATPLAKSISYADHLELPAQGSGTHGKIRAMDVKKGVPAAGEIQYEDRKISNIRRIIAENMHASLQNTAQLTLHSSADARRIKQLRHMLKKEHAEGNLPNITINDLVSYATVRALMKHPEMNAHFLGDTLRYFSSVNLGFAADTERGLMVPTVFNAGHLTLEGMAVQMKELATQAQSGKIDPELLSGATFTITNLGAFNIEMFTPVLNPPQIGILGVNTIVMRPASMEDGSFGFIPRIGLSLTFDHRAIDGAPAAAFLQEVCREIENIELA